MKNLRLMDLAFLFFFAAGLAVFFLNKKNQSTQESQEFALSPSQQLQVNRRANELLAQGDSTTGYILKKVLTDQYVNSK